MTPTQAEIARLVVIRNAHAIINGNPVDPTGINELRAIAHQSPVALSGFLAGLAAASIGHWVRDPDEGPRYLAMLEAEPITSFLDEVRQ